MFEKAIKNKGLVEPSGQLDAKVMLEATKYINHEKSMEKLLSPFWEAIPGSGFIMLFKGLLEGNQYKLKLNFYI